MFSQLYRKRTQTIALKMRSWMKRQVNGKIKTEGEEDVSNGNGNIR